MSPPIHSGFRHEKSKEGQNCRKLIDYFYISLDGDREKHDKSRGQIGSFDKTIEGLSLISDNNIPFAIETVVYPNFKDLNWIKKYVDLFSPKEVIFAPLHHQNICTLDEYGIVRLELILEE